MVPQKVLEALKGAEPGATLPEHITGVWSTVSKHNRPVLVVVTGNGLAG